MRSTSSVIEVLLDPRTLTWTLTPALDDLTMRAPSPSSPSFPASNGTHWDSTFVDTPAAWAIAGFTAALGLALSLFNCSRHLRNYTAPTKQRNIVRIVFIVPLYCVFSFLSLVIYEKAPYFNSIRDVYEAYVVYCFLNLI